MGPFRFIDSLQFLGCSLDTLVSNLSRDGTSKFNLTRQFYRDDEKTLEILTRKGVYPYEFVTDRSKMAETCLPPKEKFYSHLSESHISDVDYEHAKKCGHFSRWRLSMNSMIGICLLTSFFLLMYLKISEPCPSKIMAWTLSITTLLRVYLGILVSR